MEIFTVFYSQIPEHMKHFQYLFTGLEGHRALVPWMWTSVFLAGAALILLINPRTRKNESLLAVACVAVFGSLWIEKGLGLVVTGFIPSPLEKITEYYPTGPEVLITLGVWAMGFFILTVLYKVAISVKEEIEA
jgi:Ni/Fe-hydrogenase subunit HybB-like protein